MKIKILEKKEESGQLRIIVESDYGIDNLGLSLDKNKIDFITGKPKWLSEVITLLKQKYLNAKVPDGEEYVGKELDI